MSHLYYLPSALSPNKLRVFLEYNHLDDRKTSSSTVVICDGGMKTCYKNPTGDKLVCRSCKFAMKKFINEFEIAANHNILKLSDHRELRPDVEKLIRANQSPHDIKAIRINDLPVGEGIASSYVSRRRDHITPISVSDAKLINKQFADTIFVARFFSKIFQEHKITKFSFYNGRMYCTRPAFEVAKSLSIDRFATENAGKGQNSLIAFYNSLPHEINENTRKAIKDWHDAKHLEQREQIADSFYHQKIAGTSSVGINFNKDSKAEIPYDFSNNETLNIGVFTSSDDELFAVGREWGGSITSQESGLKLIFDLLKDQKNCRIFVRMHPNLAKASQIVKDHIYALARDIKNVEIIAPEVPISSYDLLPKMDKVVTFGSTIGIEATFFNKPSLSLRAPLYERLNVVYRGYEMTPEQINKWLVDDVNPKPIKGTRIFGYYKTVSGEPMINSNAHSFQGRAFPKPIFSKPLSQLIKRKCSHVLRKIYLKLKV